MCPPSLAFGDRRYCYDHRRLTLYFRSPRIEIWSPIFPQITRKEWEPDDPPGNILADPRGNQYLYDAEGRICAVASNVAGINTMTGYVYDADGTRVSKGSIQVWSCNPTTAQYATTSDYIVDLGGQQMSEYRMSTGSQMAWQHTNVWVGGRLIATYSQDSTAPANVQQALLHFYLDDPLGSRRVQTDYAGVTEQSCSNLPFGRCEVCLAKSDVPAGSNAGVS